MRSILPAFASWRLGLALWFDSLRLAPRSTSIRAHMRHYASLLFASVLLVADAHADNSIVIGHGIKVDGVHESAGDWVSGYVWLIDVRRTVAGPIVKGKIRIIAASHAQPRNSYLKTVQFFVLAPVIGDGAECANEPRFSLIASSPLYERDKYCIPFKPSEIAIPLSDTEIERNEYDAYCFSKRSLLEAAKHVVPSPMSLQPSNAPSS
jgi:hypothetical protein